MDKIAILVGGLCCSGKTTFAKRNYSDYFLIDDPRSEKALHPIETEDKIIIACPHLSFFKNRKKLSEILQAKGFQVFVKLLDGEKDELIRRAKLRESYSVISFIRNFELEPLQEGEVEL